MATKQYLSKLQDAVPYIVVTILCIACKVII
jgi:hypothetical protein